MVAKASIEAEQIDTNIKPKAKNKPLFLNNVGDVLPDQKAITDQQLTPAMKQELKGLNKSFQIKSINDIEMNYQATIFIILDDPFETDIIGTRVKI